MEEPSDFRKWVSVDNVAGTDWGVSKDLEEVTAPINFEHVEECPKDFLRNGMKTQARKNGRIGCQR